MGIVPVTLGGSFSAGCLADSPKSWNNFGEWQFKFGTTRYNPIDYLRMKDMDGQGLDY